MPQEPRRLTAAIKFNEKWNFIKSLLFKYLEYKFFLVEGDKVGGIFDPSVHPLKLLSHQN